LVLEAVLRADLSVAAVVVCYRSAGVLEKCLRSLGGMPVVAVDNASEDDALELARRFPAVETIANPENRGFAAAVNQAVARRTEEYVMLVNPDVEIVGDAYTLARACQKAGADIAGGQLKNADGSPQWGFSVRRFPTPVTLAFEAMGWNRAFPWNPVNRAYRYLDRDPQQAAEVDQPAGAFLVFRRALWEKLGGFDETFYPAWFEDVDFCLRARQAGAKIVYAPEAVARHPGGHSFQTLDWETREVRWYVSLMRYASKHFRPSGRRRLAAGLVAGAMVRMILSTCRRASRKPIPVYREVIRLAYLTLWKGGGGSEVGMLDEVEKRKLGNDTRLHVL
jgi:N-acetylglucosaminyl-diphospho-decaprenol L-rhamnosyltransferase